MRYKLAILIILLISIGILISVNLLIKFQNPNKKDCGNGIYETWERGIVDGPVYYYDSDNYLIATCPSDGVGASEECIKLVKQCGEYQLSKPSKMPDGKDTSNSKNTKMVLDKPSYVSYGSCHEKAQFVIDNLNLKSFHSCDVEPLMYQSGTAYYVQFELGPPQDCPAGCIYKPLSKLVVVDNIYDIANYGIELTKEKTPPRIIGKSHLGKYIGNKLQFRDEYEQQFIIEKLSPEKELVLLNDQFAIKYTFKNYIEGDVLLYANGTVVGEEKSRILTAEEAQTIAENKLKSKKGFEGYSARVHFLDDDGSWNFDVAKYPRTGPAGSDLTCIMGVLSENDVKIKCSNKQTIAWQDLPWLSWDSINYDDFFK